MGREPSVITAFTNRMWRWLKGEPASSAFAGYGVLIHINYTFQIASRADHCDPRGFVQKEIMKKMQEDVLIT